MFASVTLFADPDARIKCLALPGVSPSEITLNLNNRADHPMAGLSQVEGVMTITGIDFKGGGEGYFVHTRPNWSGVSWSAQSLNPNLRYVFEINADIFDAVGAMKVGRFTVKSDQQTERTADLVCVRLL